MIDDIFVFFVAFFTAILSNILMAMMSASGMIAPGWLQRMQDPTLGGILLGILANIAYHSLCEGIHGATLGKFCCGLRVMNENMQRSNLKGAFIRTLAFFIDCQFFGAAGYHSMSNSPLNQRYGDRWGKNGCGQS